MSHQLVEDMQKKVDPKVAVSQACRVLEASRSGYYAHQVNSQAMLGQASCMRPERSPQSGLRSQS